MRRLESKTVKCGNMTLILFVDGIYVKNFGEKKNDKQCGKTVA